MNQKGFAPFLAICALAALTVIAVGVVYLFEPQDNTPRKDSKNLFDTQDSTPSASANTNNNLENNADKFIPFSRLTGTVASETRNFQDENLKVSLDFPKKYFYNFYKSDKNHLNAGLFFLKNKDSAKEEIIEYAINCELENRIEVAGLCREYTVNDVELNILRVEKIPEIKDEASWSNGECNKNVINQGKIVNSCTSQLSIAPNDYGMSYDIYLSGDQPVLISIKTRYPSEYGDLIKTIVDTAKILP